MGIKDREHRYRFLLNKNASVNILKLDESGQKITCEIIDLSMSGVSLLVSEKFVVQPGSEYLIEMNFQFEKKFSIKARARRKISNQQYSRYKKMTQKNFKVSFEFVQTTDEYKMKIADIIKSNFS